jgi:phage terminase large subunit-like protein
MSRRKTVAEIKASGNAGMWSKAELAARAAAETLSCAPGTFGLPPRVQGLDRTTRNLWNKRAKWLLDNRLLSRADGDALMRLVEAEIIGDKEGMAAIVAATWGNRAPFPESPAPKPEVAQLPTELTLATFLASVADERATFQQRMQPGATVCHDIGGPYQWQEGDPAEMARRYALEVTQGTRIAGELIRQACNRFLQDVELGHERGIFFDPVAARGIVVFAETFCDIKLLAWQVFVLANIFGFKKPSGARRFTEAWISCAKKNGKTRLASCIALFGLVADQEKYPDIFSAATKKEQSRIVWRDARRAVQDNPELCAHVKRWAGCLAVPDSDGTFTPLSSDEKSMDGLRPHVIIADEVAFWGDRDQWDKLQKGLVSRVSPLVFAVTTAGSSKNCFAFGKFDLCEKILRKVFQDDTTFAAIFSIDKGDDSLTDESCWHKANPSLDVLLKIEHLRKTRDEVLQSPSGLNAWFQYHCNIWPEVSLMRAGSIPAAKWDACVGPQLAGCDSPMAACIKFLQLNADTPCWLGVDVGLTGDLTCVAMLFKRGRFAESAEPIDRKVVIVQGFMPEVGLLAKEKLWGVPLSAWAREGWIQLLPGDMTDAREIKKYIIELHSRFKVWELGFDPWAFRVAAAELGESGIACVEVPQVPSQLTAPARELLAAVHHKEIVHFGNPYLAWNASNVILVESEKHSGTKPEKLSPNEKIDAVSAICNAWHRMLAAPPESPYNKRGLILL